MGLVRKCDVCHHLEGDDDHFSRWGYVAINPGGLWSSEQALACSRACASSWIDENWAIVTTRRACNA